MSCISLRWVHFQHMSQTEVKGLKDRFGGGEGVSGRGMAKREMGGGRGGI